MKAYPFKIRRRDGWTEVQFESSVYWLGPEEEFFQYLEQALAVASFGPCQGGNWLRMSEATEYTMKLEIIVCFLRREWHRIERGECTDIREIFQIQRHHITDTIGIVNSYFPGQLGLSFMITGWLLKVPMYHVESVHRNHEAKARMNF